LEEIKLAGTHSRHALTDGRFYGGAGYLGVFENAPFSTTENGAGRKMLLKLPLLE
jgi:hypothetical protein